MKNIHKIFKKFLKRVEGKKLLTECIFEDGRTTTQIKKYKIKGRMKEGWDGGYSLEHTEELVSNRYIVEKLNTYFRPGTYFLVKNITSSGFELTTKYNMSQGRGGRMHVEKHSIFTVIDKTLLINSVSYVNGYFGSTSIMRIK